MKTTEAFSRVLIDQALNASGWDLLNPHEVRFELHGSNGQADYVLGGSHGPICVLEGKREDRDPYDAKEQARGYAENLHAPFVILSNRKVHFFWNCKRADQQDAYRIERLPSPEDLERVRLKNLKPPRPLMMEEMGPDYLKSLRPDIGLRVYHNRAIDEICRQFDEEGKRRLIPSTYPEWNIHQALAIFRAREGLLPQYLLYALRYPPILNQSLALAVGVRQLNLSLEQCRNAEIAFRPIPLQHKFTARIQFATDLEVRQRASKNGLNGLLSSLFQNVFGGEMAYSK